ncbi:class I SAM-dependent methyltransferase [Frankia sp. AgB32]|uniref:class I SAM-dependent methyltransferase n=1 Tax=Frankia sp. AgB32 TaxID=631119 RepID=UPI00200BD5CD|nr:class I SAM-dependent methyltransferase [Frankia sp. AgB32]MCK9895058.1 class I SAM-dependent methyltransferase [Frankia sp. AgB32]
MAAASAVYAEAPGAGGGAAAVAGRELTAGARLRAEGVPADLVAAAFSQAELRQRAAVKFTLADRMFFTRAGLEQASSQAAAEHRASRFAGLRRLADLCAGIGGDAVALATHPGPAFAARELLLVDRDPVHLWMAAYNTSVHGAGRVEARLADVRDVDLAGFDGAFVDPARRAGARRLGSGASEPPLPWCFGLTSQVPAVAVKAAPGLDVAGVPADWEIEFVADGRDLKEAVLFSAALASAPRRATVLGGGDGGRPVSLVGVPDPPQSTGRVGAPGGYLYDPSPAVTRAGLVGELGRRLDAWQIDPMIAFLTSDEPVTSPFARRLRIDAELPFDVRRLTAALRVRGIGSLEIRRRGLAGDVETLRRRLLPRRRDLVPGGPAVTVVMTRMRGEPWALLCTTADS